MEPVKSVSGIALPLYQANIDTDMIIPSRMIKDLSRGGASLFANLRYLPDGSVNQDFILSRPEYEEACILIAGNNFGCGSSREQAVWALMDYGIRALIAPGFGDIFQRNCIANGLLPVQISEGEAEALADFAGQNPIRHQLEINLETESIRLLGTMNKPIPFSMDADDRERLLRGLDPVDLTLESIGNEIAAFEARDETQRPWLHKGDGD